MRHLILAYGVLSYAGFLGVVLYMIGFVGGFVVPKNIDTGPVVPLAEALIVNFVLVLLFGVSHSVMARPAFKERLTKFIPHVAERSTFVLVANIVFAILFWQWRSIPAVIWSFASVPGAVLFCISMIGWVIVFLSTFLIDHFDLFGMRQVWLNYRGIEYTHRPFVVRGLYKYVRHPLMLGFMTAFWFAPTMTVGHMFFTFMMTIYILIGIYHEERDLAKVLGDNYATFRERTPMLFPWIRS